MPGLNELIHAKGLRSFEYMFKNIDCYYYALISFPRYLKAELSIAHGLSKRYHDTTGR